MLNLFPGLVWEVYATFLSSILVLYLVGVTVCFEEQTVSQNRIHEMTTDLCQHCVT